MQLSLYISVTARGSEEARRYVISLPFYHRPNCNMMAAAIGVDNELY